MEGLWVVKFLTPDDPSMDLNGGVVVIETGRILGGDSGYVYVGDVSDAASGRWPINLVITRHDPNVISVFGDVDRFELRGILTKSADDERGRSVMIAEVSPVAGQGTLTAQLTKVADLP